ncbi:MAG: hypothetical protein ACJAUL_002707 [Paraglaciecola sp.]|jgi:hypothetical protein
MKRIDSNPHCSALLTGRNHRLWRGLVGLVMAVMATAFTGSVSAALILHLDTTAKTVTATGSDSGITGNFGDSGVAWEVTGTAVTYSYTDLSGLFNVAPGEPALVSTQANNFNNPESFVLWFSIDSSYGQQPLTIMGSGLAISYAGNIDAEMTLESLIGSAMPYSPANGGSGFSDIQVVVPEPSIALLLAFGCLMVWRVKSEKGVTI